MTDTDMSRIEQRVIFRAIVDSCRAVGMDIIDASYIAQNTIGLLNDKRW